MAFISENTVQLFHLFFYLFTPKFLTKFSLLFFIIFYRMPQKNLVLNQDFNQNIIKFLTFPYSPVNLLHDDRKNLRIDYGGID